MQAMNITTNITKRCWPAVVLALALAPAVAAPAHADTKAPPKPKNDNCAPGALTSDEKGNITHVCDKNGNWVKVLRMQAATASYTVSHVAVMQVAP
jgi:hypothetical protein